MRLGFALAALLLPLAGCVEPLEGGYGGDYSYPGYSYNSGSPSYVVEGVRQPLVYYGGSWGYYDSYRRFHRAPAGVVRHLDSRHPSGGGYRPWAGGGGGYVAPAQLPRYNANPGGFGGYRPAAVVPGGGYGGYRPQAVSPRYVAPQHVAPQQHALPRPAYAPQPSGQHRRRDDERHR